MIVENLIKGIAFLLGLSLSLAMISKWLSNKWPKTEDIKIRNKSFKEYFKRSNRIIIKHKFIFLLPAAFYLCNFIWNIYLLSRASEYLANNIIKISPSEVTLSSVVHKAFQGVIFTIYSFDDAYRYFSNPVMPLIIIVAAISIIYIAKVVSSYVEEDELKKFYKVKKTIVSLVYICTALGILSSIVMYKEALSSVVHFTVARIAAGIVNMPFEAFSITLSTIIASLIFSLVKFELTDRKVTKELLISNFLRFFFPLFGIIALFWLNGYLDIFPDTPDEVVVTLVPDGLVMTKEFHVKEMINVIKGIICLIVLASPVLLVSREIGFKASLIASYKLFISNNWAYHKLVFFFACPIFMVTFLRDILLGFLSIKGTLLGFVYEPTVRCVIEFPFELAVLYFSCMLSVSLAIFCVEDLELQ